MAARATMARSDSNGVPIPVGEARVELSDNAGRYTRTTSMTINREAMREPGYVRAPILPAPPGNEATILRASCWSRRSPATGAPCSISRRR